MLYNSHALKVALFVGGALAISARAAPESAAIGPELAHAARRHVSLKKSSPAANDTLAASPKVISLWFSEKVDLAVTTVKVAGRDGAAAPLGKLARDATADAPVTAEVLKPLAAGPYTITWVVAGADGHPIKGTVNFVVKAAR